MTVAPSHVPDAWDGAVRDRLRFLITDAAEAIVIHEALMSYRNNRLNAAWPNDVLRAEAADRILAQLDWAVRELCDLRLRESEVGVTTGA